MMKSFGNCCRELAEGVTPPVIKSALNLNQLSIFKFNTVYMTLFGYFFIYVVLSVSHHFNSVCVSCSALL